jgi:hypothetical protein
LSILSNRIGNLISATYSSRFAPSITEWRIMAMLDEYPDISVHREVVTVSHDYAEALSNCFSDAEEG